MIKKEIKEDNSFGGNYTDELDYSVLPGKFILITEEQRDYIDANFDKLHYDETQDGIFESPKGVVDISQTPEYIAKKRLTEIEAELKNQDLIFLQKTEAIKEFNGKKYKVKYVNDYQTLVLLSFVDDLEIKDIWDATELEFISMTKAEVQALYEFLKPDYESAFQDRKTNRSKLLKEKIELQNGEMGND